MLTTSSHPSFQTPIDNQIDGITVNSKELLLDLLESDKPLIHIAMTHKLTPEQLVVWYNQPAVQNLLDELNALALRRAATKAAQARQGAIQVLQEQALSLHETPRGLDQANTAARALLRLKVTDDERQKPSRKSQPSNPSALSTQSSALPEPRRKSHPANPKRTKSNNSLILPVYRLNLTPTSRIPGIPYQVLDTQPSNPNLQETRAETNVPSEQNPSPPSP